MHNPVPSTSPLSHELISLHAGLDLMNEHFYSAGGGEGKGKLPRKNAGVGGYSCAGPSASARHTDIVYAECID